VPQPVEAAARVFGLHVPDNIRGLEHTMQEKSVSFLPAFEMVSAEQNFVSKHVIIVRRLPGSIRQSHLVFMKNRRRLDHYILKTGLGCADAVVRVFPAGKHLVP
jgi:hypothetical protein